MKRLRLCTAIVFLAFSAIAFAEAASTVDVRSGIPGHKDHSLSSMPLSFTENRGQWDNRVKYCGIGGGTVVWITSDGIFYQFSREVKVAETSRDVRKSEIAHDVLIEADNYRLEHVVVSASFVGANQNSQILGEDPLAHKSNYFLGNDPSRWAVDVPCFRSVFLRDIYPGVDIRIKRADYNNLTYEFIAEHDADLANVKIVYDGAEALRVDAEGKLTARTRMGVISGIIASPEDVQFSEVVPASAYEALVSDNTSKKSDALSPASITLEYSTYLGGSGVSVIGQDLGQSIAVDATGAAYVTGYTQSTSFPTVNEYQTDQGGIDVFTSKLSSDGSSLVYSTYLGGGLDDRGLGIAVDAVGSAYVTGWTQSLDFPTMNPYQGDQGNIDAFLAKLSPAGNNLVFCTYLGGSNMDEAEDVYVDASGIAYVVGTTVSSDFPTLNAYQSNWQGNTWDGFITKFNSMGSSITYSTYLGGADNEQLKGIAVDASGSAYVSGYTSSTDFPVFNAYQTTNNGGYDLVVTKMDNTGSGLSYSTYIGGGADDRAREIDLDDLGSAYVTGQTESADFPIQNPYQSSPQGGLTDAIVVKLSPSGSSLQYSTYLGGNDDDDGLDIVVDSDGGAHITGSTASSNFPTLDFYQTNQGGVDAFISVLGANGSTIDYSTYLGGNSDDFGCGIVLDASGDTYLTGYTESADFPTENPYQGSYQGGLYDAFAAKISNAPQYLCGDADGSGEVDIDDVVFLIAYIFAGGPAPDPLESGDADCSGAIDIDDVVYLISYIFSGGPAPCDPNGDGQPDC